MASTTFIDNQTVIYAAWLNDVNDVVYNGIFVSPSITATSMICNGTASGAGFTNLINNTFTAPGPIGSVTPNTGKFTTLQATGAFTGTTISGTTGTFSGTVQTPTLSDGTNSTSATNPIKGSAKAWLNYNGSTNTVRASYNVSSVTISTNEITVNMTNALADANYAICGMGAYANSFCISNSYAPTTTSFQVVQYGINPIQLNTTTYNMLAVFR